MTLLMIISYSLLYINTVFSRYGNVDFVINNGYLGDNTISNMSSNIIAQILYILMYFIILLLYILNIKKITSNKHFIMFFMAILCLPYILLKSTNPISYITSLSGASKLMAPGTIFSVGLFFIAYDSEVWKGIRKGFIFLWIISLALCIFGILNIILKINETSPYAFRILALKWLWAPMIVLEFTYLIPLSIIKNKRKRMIIFWISLALVLISAILTQTRLVIIMTALNAIFYSFIVERKNIIKILFSIVLILIIINIFKDTEGIIGSALRNFFSRVLSDTRSDGILMILSEISSNLFKYIPFGGGYGNEVLFADLGYLNAIFVGGIPMTFFLTILLYIPIFKCFYKKREIIIEPWVLSSALMWCFRSQISSMMSFTTEFLMFILVAGHCSSILDNKILHKNTKLGRYTNGIIKKIEE